MHVTLHKVEQSAATINTFWFAPKKPVSYIAGQYIELTAPHDKTDDRGDRRWFTLSSSPSEEYLAITTKLTAHNGSSFKNALGRLRPGDSVIMSEPMGDFVLPKDKTKPLIFVAGGIGITPMRSMLTWLQDSSEQRDITLLYATSTQEEQTFAKPFITGGINFVPVVAPRSRQQNMLSAELIHTYGVQKTNPLYYLSGPEQMVEQLVADLARLGVNPRQLVGDYFHGYPALP